MLSMLGGHRRYAPIRRCAATQCCQLLRMKKIVARTRCDEAFKAIDGTEAAAWLRGHLAFYVEPLLAEPWILNVDTTI